MENMNDLTAQHLRELLDYDPETGVFTWRVTKGPRAQAGAVAGSRRADGYLSIKIDGTHYKCHQLAWLHHYGKWPEGDVDHRNGGHADNWIDNLRDVPHAVNMQNRTAARTGSKTGLPGVTVYRKRFVAQIMTAGKQKHLGVFDTPEEAHAAYVEAKRARHEGCTL
jgi:hypothetical protein